MLGRFTKTSDSRMGGWSSTSSPLRLQLRGRSGTDPRDSRSWSYCLINVGHTSVVIAAQDRELRYGLDFDRPTGRSPASVFHLSRSRTWLIAFYLSAKMLSAVAGVGGNDRKRHAVRLTRFWPWMQLIRRAVHWRWPAKCFPAPTTSVLARGLQPRLRSPHQFPGGVTMAMSRASSLNSAVCW
jgi:hypothetical protein